VLWDPRTRSQIADNQFLDAERTIAVRASGEPAEAATASLIREER
jgi:hypothetical protein